MAAEAEEDWSRGRELNPRPTDYESVALPLSYPGVSGSYSAVGVYHELMCRVVPAMTASRRAPADRRCSGARWHTARHLQGGVPRSA